MRISRLILAPLAVAAVLASPASAQQAQSAAPYDTKLKCGVFNAFMSGFNGEDTDEGKAAESRAESWVLLAMTEKADQPEQVATDFEAAANSLTNQIEGKIESEDTLGVFAVFNEYLELCDPYGG